MIGLVLICVAVLLGLFLLARGFGDDGSPVASGDGTAVTTATTVDLNAPPTVDLDAAPTTIAVRPPSEVKVIVANASGVPGAAGALQVTLTADGYAVIDTANAATVSSTQVLYVGAYEPEALALAEALGLDSDAVSELPDPAPVEGASEANLVVLIGPDLDTSGASASGATATTASSSASTTSTTSS